MFKKILVPLDGSELAERALSPALNIAQASEADVLLLRSMAMVHSMMPDFAGEYDWHWPELSLENTRLECSEYLESVAQAFRRPGVTLRKQVMEGDEAAAILEAAEMEQVDLIVMTSHGRSGVKRWMLGSVTERTLHYAPCPVIVIRAPIEIDHMIVALDGSVLAEKALKPALAVAACLDAHVTLLHVIEPPDPLDELSEAYAPAEVVERAESYLFSITQRYVHGDVSLGTAVLTGEIVDSLSHFIAREGVDMVAMTTHGRSGVRRWVYGSVTSKVMRGCDCSMLVIRPRSEELK